MSGNGTERNDNVLEQNCRADWPIWTCIAGNVCGLTSTTLWFLVLLPQVWKNFRRKSVAGLSILWATANFTASLINIFFVYIYAHLPLYGKINAVYMPVLEFSILIQFWLYDREHTRRVRVFYAVGCFVGWGTIIVIQLVVRIFPEMEWISIVLWCIETFPQVILNMKLRSTSGQSSRSVLIATIGKMTDFLATYGLVIPIQYVIMTYFSSSVAYVNSIQVAWFYQPSRPEPNNTNRPLDGPENSVNGSVDEIFVEDETSEYTPLCGRFSVRWRDSNCWLFRFFIIVFLSSALVLFVCGLVWRTASYFSLFAPFGIILALVISYVYFEMTVRRKVKFQNE